MLEGSAGVQPHPLLGVLIGQEEAVLRRRGQTLELGQLLAQRRRRVHNRCLKKSIDTEIDMPLDFYFHLEVGSSKRTTVGRTNTTIWRKVW